MNMIYSVWLALFATSFATTQRDVIVMTSSGKVRGFIDDFQGSIDGRVINGSFCVEIMHLKCWIWIDRIYQSKSSWA